MFKTLLKDGALYTISDIATKGISFILIPLYTRKLSPSDYGIIDILSIFCQLLVYIIGLEITQSLVRFIPSISESKEAIKSISTSFWFYLTSILLFALLCISFRTYLSGVILEDESKDFIFVVGILSLSFSYINNFLQSILRIKREIKFTVFLNLSNLIITTAFSFYFIINLELGVIGSFYGILAGAVSSIIFYFSKNLYIKFIFDKAVFYKFIKFSIPLIPVSFAVYFTFFVDRIFIKEFLSINDLGIYGIAVRFASVTTLFTGGFISALSPLIFANFEKPNSNRNIAQILNFFLIGASLLIFNLALFANDIITLLTTPAYFKASNYISLIALNIILYNCYVFFPGLSIAKKTHIVTIINLISGFLNIALNFLLIKKFGIWGGILSTTISSIINLFLVKIYSSRYYPIPTKSAFIIFILCINLLVSIFLPLLFTSESTFSLYNIAIKLTISCIVFLIVFKIYKNQFLALMDLK